MRKLFSFEKRTLEKASKNGLVMSFLVLGLIMSLSSERIIYQHIAGIILIVMACLIAVNQKSD